MSLPPSTVVGDIHLWAESYTRKYDFILTNSLDEVRSAEKGDLYWFDAQTKTLYWRVITGYVDNDLTFDWINRKDNDQESFTRGNLSIADTTTKNQFQLHIDISCETDENAADAFCLEKPGFLVPGMGCPEGEVMLSIDECGLPCELDDKCEQESPEPSVSPSDNPSSNPSENPLGNPSSTPSLFPTIACYENVKAKFYYKYVKKNGKHLKKTCKWLSKKSERSIKNICKKNVIYYEGFGPAQAVCTKSCNSCDSCYENKNSKFTMKLKKSGGASYKTCKWLASHSKIAKVCRKTDSNDGYGPPHSVCPKTCSVNSCTA